MIGIWASDSAVHGIARDGARSVTCAVDAPGENPFAAIRSVLAELGRQTGPSGSVAFGVDGLLRRALQRRSTGQPAVALLQIRPRPAEPAFGRPAIRGAQAMIRHYDYAAGGHDIFGSQMVPLDLDAVDRAARRWLADGTRAVAVAAAGSLVTPDHERAVAEYLSVHFPDIAVWLSHECSGHALMVREAVTVMQAVLAEDGGRIADRLDQLAAGAGARTGARVLTSDGGRITTERLRNVPLAAIGSDCAALLLGSGWAAGAKSLTVLSVADGRLRVGRLVDGLPEVAADPPITADLDLARITTWAITLPVDGLEARRGAWSEALDGATVAIVDDGRSAAPADLSRVEKFVRAYDPGEVLLQHDANAMRAEAVARCEPVIRVQRVAIAGTGEQLAGEINRTADRAYSLLAASGGAPGTERVTEARTAPVKYLLGDTYRLQVRATAHSLGEHAEPPAQGMST